MGEPFEEDGRHTGLGVGLRVGDYGEGVFCKDPESWRHTHHVHLSRRSLNLGLGQEQQQNAACRSFREAILYWIFLHVQL